MNPALEEIVEEIHRRAETQGCLDNKCDFTVTISYEQYCALIRTLEEKIPYDVFARAGQSSGRPCCGK